ncbi:peroxiredoxin family protein [Eisenibacter elegans]|uniref:peroxiredoxin family protein n=1 Tax=Eisenibacter elegans TaxID=997 RepID=UPI000424B6F9|nr:TlpA disulfide reductase family protein [Eisenibacter elegans]
MFRFLSLALVLACVFPLQAQQTVIPKSTRLEYTLYLQENATISGNLRLRVNSEGVLTGASMEEPSEEIVFDRVEVLAPNHIRLHYDIFDTYIELTNMEAIRDENYDNGLKVKAEGAWVRNGLAEPYVVKMEFFNRNRHQPVFAGGIDSEVAPYFEKPSWAVTFTDPKTSREIPAIALIHNNQSFLKGTFMTATGDYRYLSGNLYGRTLELCGFDLGSAYVFKADLQEDGTLKGELFSGKSGYRTWVARRDDQATLPDAKTLTYLNEGHDQLSFQFPNLQGQAVSLQDARYQGKVCIIQILGSWCHNCMDEANFLAPWYEANRQRGVEVIGLAYEISPEFEKAALRVQKMKERLNIGYELLIAGTTQNANETLPALNHVMAYPTTIFVDKQGRIRKIHTGFNGPATGEPYFEYIREFEQFVAKLLEE